MAIEYGDELVAIVQIDQPLCTREYGDAELNSPAAGCTAEIGVSGTRKCYNTRATCQDAANYDPGTLTLSFSRAQEGLEYLGYVIPSIESLSITPMRINIGAMDRDASPFGQREVVSIAFADHQHSDHKVDKYRLERHTGAADSDGAYDPHERGTFWRKWLARNPYHEGYALRLYQGRIGQSLAEMEVRHYYIDKIDGPANGKVTLVAKDLFTRIEDRKAKAPRASQGQLAAGITDADGSATLSPTGIGDLEYPASGRVAIGDEIIAFTRSGDTLTLSTRGDLGTDAQAHDAEDKVQLVLSYSAAEAQDIVYDLLTEYTEVEAARIPLTDWDAESAANFQNLYTAHIAEPTAVAKLIGGLAEQAGFTIWPDLSANQIRLKALVAASAGSISYTVDDDAWIKDGTLSLRRLPDQRVSEVWVYYGIKNPLEGLDKGTNYRSRYIAADLTAEGATQYGTPAVREVFSRWIPQFGRSSAADVARRILSLFRDPPFRANFDLYAARDGALVLAEPFRLSTEDVTDDTGANKLTTHVPVKLARIDDVVRVESQQLQFSVVADADSPTTAERVLYADSDAYDVNLRAEYDALYAAPASGYTIRFIIAPGVVIGSTSTGSPALQTGSWPADVSLIIENEGSVIGKGGSGGAGGNYDQTGSNGADGGLAFRATYPVSVYNVLGTIAGGGGGGGGGGGAQSIVSAGGGGGGGGAGSNPGSGAAGGSSPSSGGNGSAGSPGSRTSGGAGGVGPTLNGPLGSFANGGDGGTGGGLATAGSSGTSGSSSNSGYAGGAGGSPGAAIDGIAYISWIDANDNPTGDDGTILGSTS